MAAVERQPLPPLNYNTTITESDRSSVYNSIGAKLNDIVNGDGSYYPDGGKKGWEAISSDIGKLIDAARDVPNYLNDPNNIMNDVVNDLTQFRTAFDENAREFPNDTPPDNIIIPPDFAPDTSDQNIIDPERNPDRIGNESALKDIALQNIVDDAFDSASFDLQVTEDANGGRTLEFTNTDASLDWAHIEIETDSSGNPTSVTREAPNGDLRETTFDLADSEAWSQQTTTTDSADNVISTDTFNDDGTRTAIGYDESGTEIWRYEGNADGSGTLTNGGDTSVNFDGDTGQEFQHVGADAPEAVFGDGDATVTVGFDSDTGATSIQLDGGTSFTTPDGSEISVGADGSVSIDTPSPGQNGDWGMGHDDDNSGPGPEPAFGDEHPNPLELRDPLVLDLNGNGIQLIDVHASNAHFDFGGSGFSIKTGWAGPTEGILVRDLDQNANTVTANELFGAISGDGFADLAAMDTNHDNKIDASDTNFAQLKVWVDADSDGAVDSGEVISLAAAGVVAINLNAAADGSTINGNTVVSTATLFELTKRPLPLRRSISRPTLFIRVIPRRRISPIRRPHSRCRA